jgi:hypothetical protein
MWSAAALKPNLVAFLAGSLGAVVLFVLFFLAKAVRETAGTEDRGNRMTLAVFGMFSLVLTLTPLWLAAGIVAVVALHLARYVVSVL